MTTPMNMLPNDHHPGPRCSCAECQRRYPEVSAPAQPTSNKLLPCPFCGKSVALNVLPIKGGHDVVCDYALGGCGASYGLEKTKEVAIQRWNRRSEFEPSDGQQIACERTADIAKADAQIERLQRQLNAKQAKIDALMLEFCPGEMSAEQRANWANSQQRAEFEPGRDLAKVAKLVPDQWPGGDVWRIGGRLFVFFEDALAAIRRTAPPPGTEQPDVESLYHVIRETLTAYGSPDELLTQRLVDEITAALSEGTSPPPPTSEHPPQLMAVVDKWQDNANTRRTLALEADRLGRSHGSLHKSDAELIESVLRDIRGAVLPPKTIPGYTTDDDLLKIAYGYAAGSQFDRIAILKMLRHFEEVWRLGPAKGENHG